MDMSLSKLWEKWWRTGKPGMLQSLGLQGIWHDWVTEQQQMIPVWTVILTKGSSCSGHPDLKIVGVLSLLQRQSPVWLPTFYGPWTSPLLLSVSGINGFCFFKISDWVKQLLGSLTSLPQRWVLWPLPMARNDWIYLTPIISWDYLQQLLVLEQ